MRAVTRPQASQIIAANASSLAAKVGQALLLLMLSVVLIFMSGCQKSNDAESNSENIAATTDKAAVEVADNGMDEAASPSEPITILALGDSLTEGLGVDRDDTYPAQLEDKLRDMGYGNVTVVNSGLSGETSTGLINRLDWVAQTNPDITILTIGANDAIRGLDVATVESNLRTAVTYLQDHGSTVILGGMQIYDNLGQDYVNSFSEIYPRVAKDMDVPLIPFFLDNVGGVADLNQADAIHPTAEGYTIIVNDNILPVLTPVLDEVKESKNNKDQSPNQH